MKTNRGKVLIAAPVHPALTDGLQAMGYICVPHHNIKQEDAFALVGDCVGIITSTRLQLNKELIDAAPLLRWIGRMGSGMEVIDVAYATARGIMCCSSPEGNCNAVGEHALGMLLGLTRRITVSYNEIGQGHWRREENRGIELEGKTVAIIGYGHTGHAFATKLQGFGVTLLAYDKYNPDCIPSHIANCGSMDRIYDEADIVSFHVPLQADTRHYCDAAFIAAMRKPFMLINTSRGAVVDTAALYSGLQAGKIWGACLDVVEEEPLTAMSATTRQLLVGMMDMPNFLVTPHIAGYTHEALYKMSRTLLQKLADL